MATASADLGKLATFVSAADAILNEGDSGSLGLSRRVALLRESYDSFQVSGGSWPVGNPDLMGWAPGEGEISALVTHYRNDRLFVEAVRRAFAEASGRSDGVVTVDEVAFNAAFATAVGEVAAEAGIDPAVLLVRRAPVTVDDPVAAGIPETSGFVNDPICTATGHFMEVEEDLVWPQRLSVLRWERVYSSRFVAEGPFGRGWASWASVRCVRQDDGTVGFQGADGQVAILTPDATGQGYQRVSGVAATLTATPEGDGNVGGWVLAWDWASQRPGEVWRFDVSGRLVSVSGPVAGSTGFEYAAGRLVGVVHESGRRLDVEWVGERIVAIRSSCGRAARYRYNDAGDLVGTERILGDRTYVVDDRGLILEVVDADGVRLCRNSYDDEGRVLVQVSPFGRETVLRYLPGNRTVLSDTDGGPVAVYEHDFAGRLTGLVDHDGHRMERSFDAEGRCVAATGFDGGTSRRTFAADEASAQLVGADGVAESWDYDDRHRVTAHRVEGGAELTYDYDGDDPAPRRIAGPDGWEMHLQVEGGLLRSVTDADGVTVRMDHDADGNVVAVTNGVGATTRIVPHVSGMPARVTMADGAVFGFERDPAGRVLSIETPMGDVFRSEWSAAGRLTALIEPNGARMSFEAGSHGETQRITDALGGVIELQHDQLARLVGLAAPGGAKWGFEHSTLGVLSLVTDPSGAVWSYDHDPEGRLIAATDPLGHETRWRYNPAGRLVEMLDRMGNATRYDHDALGRITRREDPEGGVFETDWDGLGRPTQVRLPDGETLTYSYTPAGRVASVQTAQGRGWTNSYDPAGRLVSVTDAAGGVTRFEWDACDRMTAVMSPSGRVTRHRYDGCGRVVETDQGGRIWRTDYDPAGRVVASTDPLGSTTRYAYDPRGKLVAATDPLGNTVRIRYDERGNPTGLVDPFDRVVTSSYDAMRRPIATVDELGRTTRLDRDPAGRVVRRRSPTGDMVEWRRDARGDITDVRANNRDLMVFERDRCGRLVLTHEPARNRTMALDWSPGGRLRSVAVDGAVMRWDHGPDGQVTARWDPTGRARRYTRDLLGRIATVDIDHWGRLDLGHDPDGRLTAIRGPGIERRWDHDDTGLVVGVTLSGPDGERSVELVRDGAGRVVEVHTPSGVARYRYDDAGQLVAAVRGRQAWEWHYDPAGRLAVEHGPAGTHRYRYDEAHQLVHIDGPAGRTTFAYDAAGRRTEQTGPAGTRRYQWDGLGRLSGIEHADRRCRVDVDALGQLVTYDHTGLTWDSTSPVAELVAVGDRPVIGAGGLTLGLADADGTSEWLAGDGRGSTDRFDGRDPWGSQPARAAGVGRAALGYLGEAELDGLVWLRNRVYDPDTRQFLSPDPLAGVLGLPVAPNAYAYANNDPIGTVDPLGLQGQPLTIDQYNEIRAQETGPQWNNIVTVGLVAVGVATMFIPGLNVAGAALIGVGLGAVGGAAPGVVQGIQTGEWDWGAIAGDALQGAVIGGLTFGAARFGGNAIMSSTLPFTRVPGALGSSLLSGGSRGSAALANGFVGAGTGAFSGTASEVWDVMPLPGSDGQFDLANIGASTVLGGATGAGGGAALYRPVSPNFMTHPNGETIPIPTGATGGPTPVQSGRGSMFTGGSGGHGLDPRVTGVRIMDPVTSGKYPHPNGYVSYMNNANPPQTVHPYTGQTIPKSDPMWHWDWS